MNSEKNIKFTLPSSYYTKPDGDKLSSNRFEWYIDYLGLRRMAFNGKGIKIAILDSGIDPDHSDLDPNVVFKKDFTNSAYECEDRYCAEGECEGHGTHIISIIAAVLNCVGITGIAPESMIYVGKVLGDDNQADENDLAEGIKWAICHKVDIINMSLKTSSHSKKVKYWIDEAEKAGIIVIAAAGNFIDGSTLEFPASLDNTLAIGAIKNSEEVLWSGSPRTEDIDFVSPGDEMLSYRNNGEKINLQGTSISSASFTAIVALYLDSLKKEDRPTNTPNFNLVRWKRELAIKAFQNDTKLRGYGYGALTPSQIIT